MCDVCVCFIKIIFDSRWLKSRYIYRERESRERLLKLAHNDNRVALK